MTAASAGSDEISAEKKADIETLLKLTGALRLGKQMSSMFVTKMTQALKENRPDVPPEMYDVLKEEVNNVIEEALPTFAQLIIPVYNKYYTAEEIKALIHFYSTDLGQKTIRIMPQLMSDSMSLGQQWGQALGPEIQKRVLKRFKEKGIDLSA